jgi:hypothetical protein
MITCNTERIKALMAIIVSAGLETTDSFQRSSLDELMASYNGVGPEYFPESARLLITQMYKPFEPAFLIHDWEFDFLPKDVDNFNASNQRLYRNCLRLADRMVWYRRWFWKVEAKRVYKACCLVGWAAFAAAKANSDPSNGK